MEIVGLSEAKARWASLLERSSQGETIVITRYGRPIARLVPHVEQVKKITVEEAVAGLHELRKRHRATADEIRGWINEGRRA